MNGFPHLVNAIREIQLVELKTRRITESESAERANNRDYNLSQESKDALARGDRQRVTGVYQTEQDELWLYHALISYLED